MKKVVDNTAPTYEQLQQKFQFHHTAVQHHANIANFIAEEIREKHAEEARKDEYFTDSFFDVPADGEGEFPSEEAEPTSKAR